MGFGKKSIRKAKSDRDRAEEDRRKQFEESQRQIREYQSTSPTRNAPIIETQTRSRDWLNRFNANEDVASLNPSLNRTLQNSAEQIKNTMNVASNLGTNQMARGDADYQAKLQGMTDAGVAKIS